MKATSPQERSVAMMSTETQGRPSQSVPEQPISSLSLNTESQAASTLWAMKNKSTPQVSPMPNLHKKRKLSEPQLAQRTPKPSSPLPQQGQGGLELSPPMNTESQAASTLWAMKNQSTPQVSPRSNIHNKRKQPEPRLAQHPLAESSTRTYQSIFPPLPQAIFNPPPQRNILGNPPGMAWTRQNNLQRPRLPIQPQDIELSRTLTLYGCMEVNTLEPISAASHIHQAIYYNPNNTEAQRWLNMIHLAIFSFYWPNNSAISAHCFLHGFSHDPIRNPTESWTPSYRETSDSNALLSYATAAYHNHDLISALFLLHLAINTNPNNLHAQRWLNNVSLEVLQWLIPHGNQLYTLLNTISVAHQKSLPLLGTTT